MAIEPPSPTLAAAVSAYSTVSMGTEHHVDHLVVGAGSGGCVVASVLSADPTTTVLLLEAGSDRTAVGTDDTRSPNLFRAISTQGRTWEGITATRAAGLPERPYARGLGIGGSSTVNGLIAVPGRPEDYDRWARDFDCEGWAWRDVAPTFLLLRRQLRSQPPDQWQGADRALALAARSLGHPLLSTGSVWRADGVGPAMLTLATDALDGTTVRGSADVVYLAGARSRPNLTIRTDSVVRRLLVDRRRIVGVRLDDGTEITATHVSICAGAILSPALLLRSGIEREGVGSNLCDHPAVGITLRLRAAADMARPSTAALLQTDGLQVLPLSGLGLGVEEHRLGAFMAGVLRSYGRGRVALRADDADGPPVVEFELLADARDRAALRRATRLLVELASSPATAVDVASTAIDDRGTPLAALADADDDSVDAWVRENLADYLHAAGTCRMGDPSDPAAVVDTDCKMIGYEGLSVIDASVFPDLPQANPHLPTMMVATRAATRMRASAAEA